MFKRILAGVLCLGLVLSGSLGVSAGASPSSQEVKTIKVGKNTVTLNVVRIDMNRVDVKADVILANNGVGYAESVGNMPKRTGAKIAINGTFFDAYSANNRDPYGVIKSAGAVNHIGAKRTAIGISADNKVKLSVLNPKISGTTNGSDKWPNNWYSYWINRAAPVSGDNVVIMTPKRGEWTNNTAGTNVIVSRGAVRGVSEGNTQIPADGYVVNLLGVERTNLLERFPVGTPVDYSIDMRPADGDSDFWNNKTKAIISAGPGLLQNGEIACNPAAEEFVEAKITTNRGNRSAIGITWDNRLVMVTTKAASVYELAEAMKQLGCSFAMNLDGGGSSALWKGGKYISGPGRDVSNCIGIFY